MASPKDKNEEEILERIAALYGQLDDIRDQRRDLIGRERLTPPYASPSGALRAELVRAPSGRGASLRSKNSI